MPELGEALLGSDPWTKEEEAKQIIVRSQFTCTMSYSLAMCICSAAGYFIELNPTHHPSTHHL
jgi:hypothetical protein